MEFERQHPVDRFAIRSMGSTIVLVGNRQPTAGGMLWLEQQLVSFGSKQAGRGTYLHYAFDGGDKSLPDDETRAAMKSLAVAAPKKFAAIAIVLDYAGFMGATTRAVLSGVLLAARAPKHVKIFGSIVEGRAWLDAHAEGTVPSPAAITVEVSRLRAAQEAENAQLGAAPSATR